MADQPLWEVMDAAYDAAIKRRDFQSARRDGCAAELRAIADAVVPEHECPDGDSIQRAMWLTKARIRDRLLDEADRAERRGITPPPTEPEYADP